MSSIFPKIPATSQAVPMDTESGNDNSTSAFKNVLVGEGHYEVGLLRIPARCTLPLHCDSHLSRHITVLDGLVHVTSGDDVHVLVGDESIYISPGLIFGLENRGDSPAVVVQTEYSG